MKRRLPIVGVVLFLLVLMVVVFFAVLLLGHGKVVCNYFQLRGNKAPCGLTTSSVISSRENSYQITSYDFLGVYDGADGKSSEGIKFNFRTVTAKGLEFRENFFIPFRSPDNIALDRKRSAELTKGNDKDYVTLSTSEFQKMVLKGKNVVISIPVLEIKDINSYKTIPNYNKGNETVYKCRLVNGALVDYLGNPTINKLLNLKFLQWSTGCSLLVTQLTYAQE